MILVTFPVTASCGFWSGDNDIDIEVSEEEYAVLLGAIKDAREEGWPALEEDGPCASLFPRIYDEVIGSLEDAGFDFDPVDVEITVGLPDEDV